MSKAIVVGPYTLRGWDDDGPGGLQISLDSGEVLTLDPEEAEDALALLWDTWY